MASTEPNHREAITERIGTIRPAINRAVYVTVYALSAPGCDPAGCVNETAAPFTPESRSAAGRKHDAGRIPQLEVHHARGPPA